MTTKYTPTIATEIIQEYSAAPEMLVQILHAFVARFAYLSDEAIRQISLELNLSRADVHGVVSFYHDFRTEPPGEHIVKICVAESCQAMGSRELTAQVEEKLGIKIKETTDDGQVTLEPVYCLGNCACSPAIMIDEKVYGRVDASKLDGLIEKCGG
ncbi:MAG: formate dehydrogenase subunit gamma [Gammaproteobacteria bacterium]|nr:MAG: formate dehydrogenase subunit gamma [Gammaproteobacteria bacterium]